jgi:hypothetical protein
MENLAGFNGHFRFTQQKHICAAAKEETRLRCNGETTNKSEGKQL